MNRNEIFATLKNKPRVSVLIVGGGINGIGAFRDLALNGVDVLLVERGDFCSGASAASSHMAHGGIRYLENGEFRLVREAVQERNRLLQNAPHIVKPLPTTIPIFKRFSGLLNAPLKFFGMLDKPSERGSFIIRLGLMIYDAYTRRQRAVPKHQFLSRNQSLTKWEQLNPTVVNTAIYYDGAILRPERLAIELILDAESENPNARALNYVSMVGGSEDTILLRDELTDETYDVRPQLVINAAGPWIDFTNRKLGLSTRFIGGTKGSHIIVKHDELRKAIGDHEFFFENEDGRIVLIYPFFDHILIGTSDIPIEHPDEAHCTEEEIDYFLSLTRRIFPDISLTREDIVFQFSGVRPLPHSGAKTVSQVSRERLKTLFERYGTRAESIATYMNGGTDFIIRSLPDFTLREIIFLVQHEKICHLDDFVLRRTMLGMLGRVNREMIDELARALGNALGWNEEQKAAEVARTLSILVERHGVR